MKTSEKIVQDMSRKARVAMLRALPVPPVEVYKAPKAENKSFKKED